MDMGDLEGMGIVFDEESNTISLQEDGQEKIRIHLPPGADPQEVLEELMEQMMGQINCPSVREDIETVNDALMDMIENGDPESTEVVINAMGAATKNITLLTTAVCENEEEQDFVNENIVLPLIDISKTLLLTRAGLREPSRDELIDIAANWLPIRAAVEEILDEIEG